MFNSKILTSLKKHCEFTTSNRFMIFRAVFILLRHINVMSIDISLYSNNRFLSVQYQIAELKYSLSWHTSAISPVTICVTDIIITFNTNH